METVQRVFMAQTAFTRLVQCWSRAMRRPPVKEKGKTVMNMAFAYLPLHEEGTQNNP